MLVTTSGLIVILHLAQKFELRVHELFLLIIRLLLLNVCNFFFIPFLTLITLSFKYSTISAKTIQEYSNISSTSMNFGVPGQVLSLLNLVNLITLTVFYEACSYDIRHSMIGKKADTRANHKAHLIIKAVYILNIWMNIGLQHENYELYLITAFGLFTFSAVSLIYYLPYYCFYLNFIKIFIQIDCCFIIVFIWIAFRLNNAGVGVLLTIAMQFPLLAIVYQLVVYRKSKIHPVQDAVSLGQVKFELSARKFLINGEMKEELLTLITKNLKFNKNC